MPRLLLRRLTAYPASSVSEIYLGIDVGGSGIKSALVDVSDGSMLTERERVDTPQPATPDAIVGVIRELVDGFDYEGPVGVGFPSVIRNGVVETANNIDATCIGTRSALPSARLG